MEQQAFEITTGISRQTDRIGLFFVVSLLFNAALGLAFTIQGNTDLFEQQPLMVAWHKLMLAAAFVIAGEIAALTLDFPLGRRIALQLAGYVSAVVLVLAWHPAQA